LPWGKPPSSEILKSQDFRSGGPRAEQHLFTLRRNSKHLFAKFDLQGIQGKSAGIFFDKIPHNSLKFDRELWGILSKNKRTANGHRTVCGSFLSGIFG
jgi:hypothetical protein